ncbi:hypothetical protein D0Y65_007047, partial [Glycine soja]
NLVFEINDGKESWRIMVRVVRLWMGNRVYGSIKRTLIYKFDKTLQKEKLYSVFWCYCENRGIYRITHHKYKIVFQCSTKVALVDNASVSDSVYDFVHIKDIVCGGYDTYYLVDVMGILMDLACIKCTLFGPFLDKLNAFLAFGVVENAVIIVHLAKVKCFQYKIHLQNCMCGTRVVFNAKCEDVKEMFESPSLDLSQITDSTALSMSKNFLHNTIRTTIGGLKDFFEDTCFAVFGIVKHVVDDEEWYRIKVHIIDESDSVTFVIYDWDVTILFNKSCANISLIGTFPRKITNLVNMSFLFKVEVNSGCNSQLEKTFR